VKVGRVGAAGRTWLARFEGESVTLLREESAHPAADALREALADGVSFAAAGESMPITETEVLAPVANPSKIICIGLNYADHAAEAGVDVPDAPVVFAKFPNALIGPTGDIRYRSRDVSQLDFEAELAVVIGSTCSLVKEADALDHVFGYTILNDISARDAQFADGQWVRGKSFDTFAPVGPAITTRDEISDVQQLGVRCLVNGEVMQDGSTADMCFGVAELVSYLSRFITLVPGDVIATGTPAGIGFTRNPMVLLGDGDVVVTEIDQLGQLRNVVTRV
jgi:2-keto-4-pentenoate hydratase/2-oxohepta-3-ene-1,7-dioic acid hydratase in catechol pathway